MAATSSTPPEQPPSRPHEPRSVEPPRPPAPAEPAHVQGVAFPPAPPVATAPGGDAGPPEASARRWPAWYAPLGFVSGLVITGVIMFIVGIFAGLAGEEPDVDSPALTVIGTFVQDAAFILAAIVLAAQTLRPQPWHFGLRRARIWQALGWTAVAGAAFFLFEGVYSVMVQPQEQQDVAESLGVGQGTGWLIAAAVVVIGLAPVAEEFFFRGFFYRALRNGLVKRIGVKGGILAAAAIDGLLFGAIHISPVTLLPPLMVLGFVFCLLYERTGTLYTVIALHAVNNTLAFSLIAKGSAAAAVPVGAAMVAGCLLLPRVLPGHAPAAQAVAP